MLTVKPLPATYLRRVSARQPAPPLKPWMTPGEAAEALGVSKPTLYRLARAGLIPGANHHPGMRWVFIRTEIEAQATGMDMPAPTAPDEDAALVERIKRLEDRLENIGRSLLDG